MKKSDLKNGMIVELKSGEKYMVLTNVKTTLYGKQEFILTNPSGFLTANAYDEDLDTENDVFSIVKVYNVPLSSFDINDLIKNHKPIWERKEPEYIDLHKQSGFKVGHIVKITKRAKTEENGWNNSWVTDMNYTVGKTGYIVNDEDEEGFFIRFNNGLSYYYPYFVLELVD